MVLITGSAGLVANLIGLFLFHEHGHGHHHHHHDHDVEQLTDHSHGGHLNMRGVMYIQANDDFVTNMYIDLFACAG